MKHWLTPAMFVLVFGFGLAVAVAGASEMLPWVLMALILPVSMWYLEDGRRATGAWFPLVFLIAVIAAASTTPVVITATGSTAVEVAARNEFYRGGESSEPLKKFSSYEELENFVKENVADYREGSSYYYSYDTVWSYGDYDTYMCAPCAAGSVTAGASASYIEGYDFSFSYDSYSYQVNNSASVDFSTTNVQVAEVDEADIVKSDGEYIYLVSGNKIFIIGAYPAEVAEVLSEIEENDDLTELFINGDKLAALGRTYIRVYDVSDRENPVLVRDVSFSGDYFNSRMIGDYVYVITNSPVVRDVYNWDNSGSYIEDNFGWYYRTCSYVEVSSEIVLPEITVNDDVETTQATGIYYYDVSDDSYRFTTIMTINIQDDDEEITTETILMSTANNIFVSSNNIYITYTKYPEGYWFTQKTVIHKVSISDGEIEYKCCGEVPGSVLNQFSMDGYQGYFRIATTTGDTFGTGNNEARNHIYVLDGDLEIVGGLENLARTEIIYAARFMGDRAYLVTFRDTDPLFVLDLSDPENPAVLGELEIPGYSDYLHPYDETHIIGVGRDDGVKIALFDVSDPENPVEISKYEVGSSWWTDSYALDDHRAFLFSRAKNLLVMPIGSYYQQDAYVFNISPEEGITLRGTITHGENNNSTWSSYYYWYYDSGHSVKRSLYIDDVLYTISEGLVKMNDLEDLSEINEVELQ